LTARAAIADRQNENYVSAVSAWEFVTKFRSGKEPGFINIAADVAGAVAAQGMTELPLTMRHCEVASNLPPHHKDPMDRFLIGQAIVGDMTIITIDGIFASYPVKRLW
jgi:PIN domain nuclease of toxin-antitoxin system